MACKAVTRTSGVRVSCVSCAFEARELSFYPGCPGNTFRLVQQRRSHFSRSRGSKPEVETLDVVCGSSGRITVDLYNSQALRDPSAPLILYLPPTGTHLRDTHPPIPRLLLSQKDTALAQINYRWNIPPLPTWSSSTSTTYPSPPSSPSPSPSPLPSSSQKSHPFPFPLHDTLHALDCLTQHLKKYTQSKIPPSSPYAAISSPERRIQRPLLIHGSFLGGTLATSLALTESHTSRYHPFKIIGLITKNAVFDWSVIAATKSPPISPPPLPPSTAIKGNEEQGTLRTAECWSSKPWTSDTLHNIKSTLFTSPQSAFDPFVSPILFFRTSGYDIPKRWPGTLVDTPEPKPSITSIVSDPEDGVVSLPTSPMRDGKGIETKESRGEKRKVEGEGEEEDGELGRKYPLKFPPSRSHTNPEADLELPRALFITTTSPSPYKSPSPSIKSTLKQAEKLQSTTPHIQALELQTRMYRSIELQESRRNAHWQEWGNEDSDSDAREEKQDRYADTVEQRVKVLEVDLDFDLGGSGDGHEEIRDWIEDAIG